MIPRDPSTFSAGEQEDTRYVGAIVGSSRTEPEEKVRQRIPD